MSLYSVFDYGSMIADRVRMDAYIRALRAFIRPDSVVLDIGTGTGIFALLACQMGARRVYAVEPDDSIQLAKDLAVANGFADHIVFFQKLSTEVTLPERADVIVSDLQCQVLLDTILCFGGFGFPANPSVPAHPRHVWASRDGAAWVQVSDAPWNADGPEDVKYDFDSLVVQGGAGGLRPSIFTFGGDREASFAAPDPALVDDEVWRLSPPASGRKP